ncbi:hypothetical protein [Polyangium sorediatum]|uniref:Phospholipase D-like domain-containing protein n=1 Tax=Polyangium sorediatum TaxID=889274 RepID=A0ABT6NY57_9BACT|nr:hypothetical protein [Polyangium sorediatum]MDI1433239.1 hypothetical protein [Polyangium sorediatum]
MPTIELLRHGREMGARLAADLGEATRACIAVSRAEASALGVIDLVGFVERGGELMLLAGFDGYGTETAMLRRFERMPGARCRIYHAWSGTAFLPRLYVLDIGPRRVVYVGSSDLAASGLSRDLAVNVRIEGSASEPELERPMRLFEELFWSELSWPLSYVFEAEYEALRAARRAAIERAPDPSAEARLGFAVAEKLGEQRGKASARRHLLVVTAKSYALCMQTKSFGRRRQAELDRYGKGDPFFFHVTGRGRGLRAMGMFTGETYRDEAPSIRGMDGGAPPFRKKFVVLGELGKEIRTRPILESLRPGAPKHWFNGFVQDSHTLSIEDFEALRGAFVSALAGEQGTSKANAG